MNAKFTSLLSKHVGSAFAKQLAFADFLGDRGWGVNISEGLATFGDDLSFPIQLLGTEADGDVSWLWAWANEQSNLPANVLVACSELKRIGSENGIPELTERSFSQDVANGHQISMIASGLNSNCCYYRGPYDGGALYFLVCAVPSELLLPVSTERVVTVINESISQFDLNHKEMVTSFLHSQQFSIQTETNTVIAQRNNDALKFSFDSLGRIENIDGTLKPTR